MIWKFDWKRKRMKILIVSGFLGAGKTTFIKRLARNVDQRFAILENEYGAAGIDGARLGQNRQGTRKMYGKWQSSASAASGKRILQHPCWLHCQCGRPGIPDRRTDRRRKSRPDYRKSASDRVRENSTSLASAIVDVYSYRRYMAEYPELYQDQIRSASTIIVSKTETHARRKKNSSRNFCRKLTRRQKSSRIMHPRWHGEDYRNLLLGDKEVQDTQSGEKMPETFSFENIRMEAPKPCGVFERIIRGAFGNIIRAKDRSQPETSFSNLMSPITATASPAQNRKTPARLCLSETIWTKMRSGSILRNAPETRKWNILPVMYHKVNRKKRCGVLRENRVSQF